MGQTQNAASGIELPKGPRTYAQALDIIAGQLKVKVGHQPGCRELLDSCHAYGQMTFGKFFEPLKARGLTFVFTFDGDTTTMLSIQRAKPDRPTPMKPRTFVVFIKNESGQPAPGVTVRNLTMHKSAAADSLGMVRFEYNKFPVTLFLSHIGLQSVRVTILKDSMTIILAISPQSLDAAMVSLGSQKRAVSTSNYSTILDNARSYPYYGSPSRLAGVSTATVQTMLEGLAPGLLVTESSGISGSSRYLTIRGQPSVISGTDPLYVIDGVPSGGGNASTSYIQSGLASGSLSPWNLVAPSDIERLDVLRDADATAIYGSRGAGGVILITTKHWKPGLPKVEVDLSWGGSKALRRTAFMNTPEYLATRREALQNSGITPDSTNAPDLFLLDTKRNIDWGHWLYGRNAPLANTRVAVSGGKMRDNYTIGMNYLKESLPFPTQPDHDRLTANFNYNHQSLNRRWTLRLAGLSGWDANHQFVSVDPTVFQTLAPDAPAPLTPNGQLNFPPNLPYYNPLSSIRQPYEALSSNYLLSVINSYQLTTDLAGRITAGFNRIRTREYGATPVAAQDPAWFPSATGYFGATTLDSRILQPQLEYNHRMGKLLINGLGGASFQVLGDHAAARTDTGYTNDIALQRHEHAQPEDTSSLATRDVYTAYFGNLNANWDDRIILNLTGRRDGSSRFPTEHRYGNFGAIAVAWIFSDVNLIRRLTPFISYGKIKVSEGVTGNNQPGDRAPQNIPGTSIESFQASAGPYSSNPIDTSWEKTLKRELSLDLGFLQNRILFNATAYRHRSANLLPGIPLTMTRSSSVPTPTNWPVILENSGYEFSLSATLADNSSFGWDVSLNWTVPKSKLTSFPQLEYSPYAGHLIVGQSINIFKGFVSTGVDRQTGLYSFADLNHDGKLDAADQRVVGKFDVTGFGGFENIIRWRQFQFQVLIDARLATGVNYLAVVFANNPPGTINAGLNSNVPRVLLDHWRHPGDKASYQKLYAAPDVNADSALNRYLYSSAVLANTSFLRLRKLSIAYNLPSLKALAMHLTGLTFFIDAQNLFVLSPYKIDPEIQSVQTMPTMRTIEVGIRLTH